MASNKLKAKRVGEKNKIEIYVKNVMGSGAVGKVFAGKFAGGDVAVKRMDIHNIPENKTFQTELAMIRGCRHKNTVKYLFHDKDDEYYYIVLEKCLYSLSNYLREKAKLMARPTALIIMHQAASGFEYLHSRKIIHRDVKPSNILLAEVSDGLLVKIADFGISKKLDSDKTSISASFGGTHGYLSSEVINSEHIGMESDIFSLGIVFYEILSGGKHPFGSNLLDRDNNIRSKKPAVVEDIGKDDMRSLISSMLVHEPKSRPSATSTRNSIKKSFEELFNSSSHNPPKTDVLLDSPFPKGKAEEEWSSWNWLVLYGSETAEVVSENSSAAKDTAEHQGWIVSKTSSANIDRDGGCLGIGDNRVVFQPGTFNESTDVEARVEIDSSKWPKGYIGIAPVLFVKAGNDLLKPATVHMTSWCTSDGTNEGRETEVIALHKIDGSDNWDEICRLRLGSNTSFQFDCPDFSPIFLGIWERFFGPQNFLVDGFFFMTEQNEFSLAFLLKSEVLKTSLREEMESRKYRWKITTNTVLAKRNDAIAANIKVPEGFYPEPADYEFSITSDFISAEKKVSFDCLVSSDTALQSTLIPVTLNIKKNDRVVDGNRRFNYLWKHRSQIEMQACTTQPGTAASLAGGKVDAMTSAARDLRVTVSSQESHPWTSLKMNNLLYKIVDNIKDNDWPRFARVELDLDDHEIDRIEADNKGNTVEKRFEMLKLWTKRSKETEQNQKKILIDLMENFLRSAS